MPEQEQPIIEDPTRESQGAARERPKLVMYLVRYGGASLAEAMALSDADLEAHASALSELVAMSNTGPSLRTMVGRAVADLRSRVEVLEQATDPDRMQELLVEPLAKLAAATSRTEATAHHLTVAGVPPWVLQTRFVVDTRDGSTAEDAEGRVVRSNLTPDEQWAALHGVSVGRGRQMRIEAAAEEVSERIADRKAAKAAADDEQDSPGSSEVADRRATGEHTAVLPQDPEGSRVVMRWGSGSQVTLGSVDKVGPFAAARGLTRFSVEPAPPSMHGPVFEAFVDAADTTMETLEQVAYREDRAGLFKGTKQRLAEDFPSYGHISQIEQAMATARKPEAAESEPREAFKALRGFVRMLADVDARRIALVLLRDLEQRLLDTADPKPAPSRFGNTKAPTTLPVELKNDDLYRRPEWKALNDRILEAVFAGEWHHRGPNAIDDAIDTLVTAVRREGKPVPMPAGWQPHPDPGKPWTLVSPPGSRPGVDASVTGQVTLAHGQVLYRYSVDGERWYTEDPPQAPAFYLLSKAVAAGIPITG